MKTVIFGCGKIANRVAKGFAHVTRNELVGFASRDLEKAKEYANTHGVERYGNYKDFLNDPSIDAVYICTYNLNHYELISECLKHHKHVMCEKPMALSVKENDELFELAKENNVLLMEALKSVFLPITNKVKQMINDKTIGEIHHIEASFVRNGDHPKDHWVNDVRCGVTKDLAEYCIGTINYLLDKKPIIKYKYKNNTKTMSDNIGEFILNYDDIDAHVLVSNSINGDSSLKLFGTKGMIVIDNYWKTGNGYYILDGNKYEINEELISDFHYEIQHFSDCVNNNLLESPIMSKEFSHNLIEINE